MTFCIKIANIVIELVDVSKQQEKWMLPFVTEDRPDFSLLVTKEDLVFEKEQVLALHLPVPLEEMMENSAILRKIAVELLRFDAFLFHASCICYHGKAYAFTAESGTGKSTHVSFWKDLLGEEVTVINDDKPILRKMNQTWFACGNPWNGKTGQPTTMMVPLEGIISLERGKNELHAVSFSEIFPVLFSNTFRPSEQRKMTSPLLLQQTVALVSDLKKSCNFYLMKCQNNINAAQTAIERLDYYENQKRNYNCNVR